MTLTSVLQQTSTKDLLRAVNSNKQFIYFDVSVFNVGACVRVRCSNTYKQTNMNTWNGYDTMVENDYATEFYIMEELKTRVN